MYLQTNSIFCQQDVPVIIDTCNLS